jgi:spore maturation protein SpmA
MESLRNKSEKDKASDAQIMFMCLHAWTYVDCYFIIIELLPNASNPADVMLPCIITSFIGTIAAF